MHSHGSQGVGNDAPAIFPPEKGQSCSECRPPALYQHSVTTDSNGFIYVFGGSVSFVLRSNQIWRYDPESNEWAWLGGSSAFNTYGNYGTWRELSASAMPASRYSSGAAIHPRTGNLWLFAGQAYASGEESGPMNDLWEFDPSMLYFRWVSGTNSPNQFGVYNTRQQADSSTVPGSRAYHLFVADSSGSLWAGFGFGYGSSHSGNLNDLFLFDTNSLQWTWVHGTGAVDNAGIFPGTVDTESPENLPAGRRSAAFTIDRNDMIWIFGGQSSPPCSGRNDLWRFNTATYMWSWWGGASACDAWAVYGTKGVASTANVSGARYFAALAADASGNLWLTAGFGYIQTGTFGFLNDVWKWNPTEGWMWAHGSSLTHPGSGYNYA